MNRHNDEERRLWVLKDEGLYRLYYATYRCQKGGLQGFIRSNRKLIDEAIDNVVSGAKPSHYKAYGG